MACPDEITQSAQKKGAGNRLGCMLCQHDVNYRILLAYWAVSEQLMKFACNKVRNKLITHKQQLSDMMALI